MTFLETFAVLLVIWGLLAVIVIGAFYLTGYIEMWWHRWQGRRQAAREYRQFSDLMERDADLNRMKFERASWRRNRRLRGRGWRG